MAVVASDQTHRIRLKFTQGHVHLNVLTPDLGEGHDELEIGYDGEDLEIGFNANYLLEVLRYMPSDDVRMGFKAPERAATMEPVAEGDEAMDYLCLVMPLRLLD
jgi:DNA polymerase-3 subunit beta